MNSKAGIMTLISATFVALIVTSVLSIGQGQTQTQGKDATRVKNQSGDVVVNAVVAQISAQCIFSDDHLFLRRVAYAMSEDGRASNTYRSGFDGGIWQVTESMFNATKACSNTSIQIPCANITAGLNITWATVKYSELRKPLYSGLAAALSAQLALAGDPMPGSIADQGQYWLKMYGGNDASPFTSKADIPEPACNDKMDLVFILDASGSISSSDFGLMLKFTSDLTGALNLSRDAVRLANIVYSTTVEVVFTFNGYNNKTDAQAKLLASPKEDWNTFTNYALDEALAVMYNDSLGARQDAKKVAILITDGQSSSRANTVISAAALRKPGTNVFAVGVGNYFLPELHAIASPPTCSHVLTLTSFDEIKAIHTEILKSSCEANEKFTEKKAAGGPIERDGTNKTTETESPGNNQTIKASVFCATLDVYVSTTNPKPSPTVHSHFYHSTPNHPAILTITENLPTGTVVYVTVVGSRLPDFVAQAMNCTEYNWTLAIVNHTSVPIPDTLTVAIEGGGRSGRLLATLNGVTGTVCNKLATDDLAAVICKELGYNVTRARLIKVPAATTYPFVMGDVYCRGSESKLGECVYVNVSNCDHSKDIGIECPSDDPCESSPCLNGGQCNKIDVVNFFCQCTADYTGSTCQTYVNPCDSSPCQNGGMCVRDNACVYHCNCPPGIGGTNCDVFETCSMSLYTKLTTFAGENVIINAPCAFDLVSMQCGDFNVKAQVQSRVECKKVSCIKAGKGYVIDAVSLSVTSSQVTWQANLAFGKSKLAPTVSGDSSLVRVVSDASKVSLTTSDRVLSLAVSKDDGIKLLCSDMKSSDEYPTSLCGAGASGKVTIADRTKDLGFGGDYETVVFDILTNANINQTQKCKGAAGTLLDVCEDPAQAFEKCHRCARKPQERVKVNCLRRCLPRKGDCKGKNKKNKNKKP